MNTDANIAVMSVEIRYVRQAVDEIKDGMRGNVMRSEWEQRNAYVDQRIAEIHKELAARRVSWPAVGALVVSVSLLLFELVPRLTGTAG